MSQQIAAQAQSLLDAIEGYRATDNVPWQIGQIVNALVTKAREESDDPTLAAIGEFQDNGRGYTQTRTGGAWMTTDIGTIRVIAKQIYSVTPVN